MKKLITIIAILSCFNVNAQHINSGNIKMNVSAGTYVSADNIILENSAALDNSGTIILKGNWINNASGLINNSNGMVKFEGNTNQSISGSSTTVFNKLSVNNSAGVILNKEITVTNNLQLNNGIISTGNNDVIILPAASISSYNNTSYINGNLKIGYDADDVKFLPVGDDNFFAPVEIAVNNVLNTGYITVNTTQGYHPGEDIPIFNSSGINLTSKADRYWSITNNGLALSDYDAVFHFNSSEATGDPLNYVIRKFDGSWSTTNAGTVTNLSTQATGLTTFGSFITGEKNPLLTNIHPSNSVICDLDNTSFFGNSNSTPVVNSQWQVNDGNGFVDLSNIAPYAGINTTALTITEASTQLSGYEYRVAFSNINGTVYSNSALLTVNPVPNFTIANSAPTVYYGYPPLECADLSFNPVNSGTYSYSWSTGATSPAINVCPITNSNYTLIVHNEFGCQSSETTDVNVIDVRCGNGKVKVCKPSGNKSKVLCLNANAVASYLADNPGAYLGDCVAARLAGEENANNIVAYPNPASEKFNIKYKGEAVSSLEISDIIGRVVYKMHFDQATDFEITISATDFNPGLYIIKVGNDDVTTGVKKLILKN